MLEIKDKIRTVVSNLCELRTVAHAEGQDTSGVLDLTRSDNDEVNRLKRDLNYSVGELADTVNEEVTSSLKNKSSFYIPSSLDEIVGKILVNINHNPDEQRIQIGNILDRMFRLPIDRELDNLHHPQTASYRKTSQLDPELSTLIKALMISPLIEAKKASENEDIHYGIDTSQWGKDYEPGANNHLENENESIVGNDLHDEYERIIDAMPEISIPYFFHKLKKDHSSKSALDSLAHIGLIDNPKYEQALVDILIEEGSKLCESTITKKKSSEKFYLASSALAEFKQLSYNPDLINLLKQLLRKKPDVDIRSNIFKIFSKIQYGDIVIEQGYKTLLLAKATNAKQYSDLNFYAVIALANNTKSLTEQDTSYLLEALEQIDTNKLITALLIKIGQTRDDLRPLILKGAWSKINYVIDNVKAVDAKLETTYSLLKYQELFSCLDIIKELSSDRSEIDKFIKSKRLEERHQDELKILMLVLGLYEDLTVEHNLPRDIEVDNLQKPMKVLDGQGLFDNELVIKWQELASSKDLIKGLQTEDINDDLQENIYNSLRPFMHSKRLINELKDLAINSNSDVFKQQIIHFLGFSACDLNHCLEHEANDTDLEPGPGNYTATKLILGDPSKEIKAQAIDAILEIMAKNKSAEINLQVSNLIDFLGPEAYEQVTKATNETSSKQKAQLAELIMLNSRYLRSISYPAAA